jgi:hypothetical protein
MGYEASRVISSLLAIASLGVAYALLSDGAFHLTVTLMVLPLGCIWYGEEIGSFTVNEDDNSRNPIGALITYAGWVMLLLMAGLIVWFAMGSYR